ncbi:MAG TPA: sulfatase-like hydrolase/transferase [bacterium]|nr:sulfatase-like hydrolase/transferase [bacterium]
MSFLLRARRAFAVPALIGPLLLSGLPGCGDPGAPAPARLVLLVTLDTLPADRIGCYGSPGARTPEIDRMARQGLQVPDALSPVPLTLPTHSTLLTGLDPTRHGVRENGMFVLSQEQTTVPEMLPPGIEAAAFVGAYPVARQFGLAQGFGTYDDTFPPRKGDRVRHQPMRRAEEVFAAAAAWLDAGAAGDRPFLWTHAFDPHYPYEAPSPWPQVAAAGRGTAYDGEVAYTDRALGRFLRRIGVWRRDREATVVLTADHGESLGAHGELTHGLFVYDATQRVPLLAAGPAFPPRLAEAQRPLLDVAPTLLAAYGVQPPADLPGVPLQETVAPGRAVYLETKDPELMRGWSPLFAMRTDRWKYVRAPRPELYDLQADPGETRNRFDDHPDVTAELSALLDRELAADVEATARPMDDETLEQLRTLGYVATAEPGAPGDPRVDPKDRIESVALMFRGVEAYLAADLVSAERYLRRALQRDPESKECHSYLAGTYYGLGRFGLAAEHASRALELPPHLNEAPLHTTFAEALIAIGRPAEAAKSLREALRLKPGDPRASALLQQLEGRAP